MAGMINGVLVDDVEVDDFIDVRDSQTLWFWPNGYGVGQGYELKRDQVEDMFKSLAAMDFESQDPDDIEIQVLSKYK